MNRYFRMALHIVCRGKKKKNEAAILCRIPSWWKKTAAVTMQVSIGEKPPSTVGMDALKELTNGFTEEAELLEEAQYDNNGDLLKIEIPWLLPANAAHAGMENTVHGHLIIAGLKMTCEVNSAERAERLRAIIEERLPEGEATYKTTVIQSADSMMRNAPPSNGPAPGDEELMNLPEVRAHIEQMMRKHWEAWPDMELPALQGRTPRQAVKDEFGRRQVSALLEDAEKSCREGDGTLGSRENLEWVRRALGLEKL
jgi:hypothetical protein